MPDKELNDLLVSRERQLQALEMECDLIFKKVEKELTRRRAGIVEQQQEIQRNPGQHWEWQIWALEMQCDLLSELHVWLEQVKVNSEVQNAESR